MKGRGLEEEKGVKSGRASQAVLWPVIGSPKRGLQQEPTVVLLGCYRCRPKGMGQGGKGSYRALQGC